ncbi:MAG: hypothetical protein ACOVSW_22040, partial [Candidatus Kapaibacteriota bacterium]
EQYPQFEYRDFISGKKRISGDDLHFSPSSSYYICGPDSLKERMVSALKDLKIPKSQIHGEHFADGYTPWFGLLKARKTSRISKTKLAVSQNL